MNTRLSVNVAGSICASAMVVLISGPATVAGEVTKQTEMTKQPQGAAQPTMSAQPTMTPQPGSTTQPAGASPPNQAQPSPIVDMDKVLQKPSDLKPYTDSLILRMWTTQTNREILLDSVRLTNSFDGKGPSNLLLFKGQKVYYIQTWHNGRHLVVATKTLPASDDSSESRTEAIFGTLPSDAISK